MTTLLKLPEEVLLMILEELPQKNLVRVKPLCRMLYRLTQLILLRDLHFNGPKAMEGFLGLFDQHSDDPSYIHAVKKITYVAGWGSIRFDKDLVERLFFRFPNLKDIVIKGRTHMLDGFTDELNKTILKNCPKLDAFEAHLFCDGREEYCNLIYKARFLQTEVDLEFAHDNDAVAKYGGIQQFVRNFPRLQKIYGWSDDIDNFEKLLQIVESAPQLRYIDLKGMKYDQTKFADQYFSRKTTAEQDAIKETLSQITNLQLSYYESICLNAMKFAAKHLTGLESFSINNNYREKIWNPREEEAFVYMLFILGSVKKDCKIDLFGMDVEFLGQQLPNITHTIFYLVPFNTTWKKRTLQVKTKHTSTASRESFPKDSAELHNISHRWINNREIQLEVSSKLSLHELVTILFNSTDKTFDYIDSFELDLSAGLKYQCRKSTNVSVYEHIFTAMPMLKELYLDLRSLRLEMKSKSINAYPCLEKLTLRATPETKIQPMLTRCGTAFPNLKYLSMYYSTGIWNEDLAEFQIALRKNALDKLTVDMTPVKSKMGELEYFVLETQSVSSSKRQLHIISNDLFTVFKVNDEDLEMFFNGAEFVRVLVVTKSLKKFELLMYPYEIQKSSYLEDDDAVRRATIDYQ